MNTLPIEIYHLIAQTSESAYVAMLAIPTFAKSLTLIDIGLYMDLFGYYIITYDDCIQWFRNGQLHCRNGPAMIMFKTGANLWYQYGKFHRVDGPAVIAEDGTKYWYQYGKLHREDIA